MPEHKEGAAGEWHLNRQSLSWQPQSRKTLGKFLRNELNRTVAEWEKVCVKDMQKVSRNPLHISFVNRLAKRHSILRHLCYLLDTHPDFKEDKSDAG